MEVFNLILQDHKDRNDLYHPELAKEDNSKQVEGYINNINPDCSVWTYGQYFKNGKCPNESNCQSG